MIHFNSKSCQQLIGILSFLKSDFQQNLGRGESCNVFHYLFKIVYAT